MWHNTVCYTEESKAIINVGRPINIVIRQNVRKVQYRRTIKKINEEDCKIRYLLEQGRRENFSRRLQHWTNLPPSSRKAGTTVGYSRLTACLCSEKRNCRIISKETACITITSKDVDIYFMATDCQVAALNFVLFIIALGLLSSVT